MISADDVTYRQNLSGSVQDSWPAELATTLGVVEEAAVPFGKTRNGMILGSEPPPLLLKQVDFCRERGLAPVSKIVSTHIGNSAFHATRLDPTTIREAFKKVVDTLVSHSGLLIRRWRKTWSSCRMRPIHLPVAEAPAAEVDALRYAFGPAASKVLIANTKGYTGHPMGATLEDAVLMKALQRGYCPPVANLNEVDPAFSDLNLSRGHEMTRRFGIRFAAGFGSQMVLVAYEQMARSERRLEDEARFSGLNMFQDSERLVQA